MTTAHTATPWQVNDNDSFQICDADGEVRGCAPIAFMHSAPRAEKIANAKFIVRACNAHDDLVKALQAARDALRDCHPAMRHFPETTLNHANAIAAVSAALAKAGAA